MVQVIKVKGENMEYDFNIIDGIIKHSFTIDEEGIYKWEMGANHRNYHLSNDELDLINKCGGYDSIMEFLRTTSYGIKKIFDGGKIELINIEP